VTALAFNRAAYADHASTGPRVTIMRVVVFMIAVSMLMRVRDAIEMLMGMTVFDTLSVLYKVKRRLAICQYLFKPC
jgi:hypothetical protein